MPTECEFDTEVITGDIDGPNSNVGENIFDEGWLNDPEFQEWLQPCQDDASKAICSACNSILHANKSELLKHASEESHINSANSKSVQNLLGNLNTACTTFKTVSGKKIIVIKRNPSSTSKMDSNIQIINNETSSSSNSPSKGTVRIQTIKRVRAEDFKDDALKRKPKPFRPEWLKMDIFKDWLAPDPENPCKARCVACNTVLNAGKSELEKHAVGAKHTDNLDALRQSLVMQQMMNDGNIEEEEIDDFDEDEDDYEYERYLSQNPGTAGTGHVGERHLEVLNRIADSLDSLTAITSASFEKLIQLNESLLEKLSDSSNK